MKRITSVLVANRGEIACRVIRTAKSMGLRTVAVFSDADVNALHVKSADSAVRIGPAPVAESYLDAAAVLAAAAQSGADAIHPGYGFLSENQAFASACEDAGIVFIGPPNGAIEIMGDKARAKIAMIEAGVPCIPGYQGEDQSLQTLTAAAEEIGMPVMVKAAAGGGGRGMRLVTEAAQLSSAIGLAQSEAENAFGSSDLIIEKAVVRPRHVEIQVFADRHGNVVHLGERDCSIQRRHQKVVEESPCPVMTPELRAAMGAAAVEAARAVDYVGAGTVEFLLDANGEFFFLEMNTRLQVEHPVTELVTGYDLVEWQLRVARGEALPVTQEDIDLFGHAIEIRLYAEDPATGFLPSTGPIHQFDVPERDGLRVDTGVESGDEVSPYYDAMVAKIIAYGETREDARVRLVGSLKETSLLGLKSNRDFLIDVLGQQVFADGEATTAFIADHYGEQYTRQPLDSAVFAAAAVIQHQRGKQHYAAQAVSVSEELLDWSSMETLTFSRRYLVEDEEQSVALRANGANDYTVSVGDEVLSVSVVAVDTGAMTLAISGRRQRIAFFAEDLATLHVATDSVTLTLIDQLSLPPESADAAAGGAITSPMHGQLLSVAVTEGQAVAKGDRVAVLEAMKMQHEITASVTGRVVTVAASAGMQLAAGDPILTIEADSESEV